MDRRDPYRDILAGHLRIPAYPQVEARRGLQVGHKASGFRGVVVFVERDGVVVRGATGMERAFRLSPGAFVVDGRTATVVLPPATGPDAPGPGGPGPLRRPTTASGSLAVARRPPRVARASRLLVEGVHDAELVERVWGDDLRVEGIVVERLDGLDHLGAVVASFEPGPTRRLGVLVDHLVPGSKEARLVEQVDDRHVLVTGTPFIDIWEAVKPAVVGIPRWPSVPHGIDWKTGVCRQLGVVDPPSMWRRILASVHTYADLAPELVGAVERLIDFVTEPAGS